MSLTRLTKSRPLNPYVLLNGGDLENKGDHLMLRAVLSRVHQWDACAVWDTLRREYSERAILGLYQRLVPRGRGKLAGTAGRWFLSRYGKSYGIVADEACATVLDLRGYAFGDSWPLQDARAALRELSGWTSHARVVLLPQAFGPFGSQEWREVGRSVATTADLCFARDRLSLEFLRECGVKDDKLRIAPDITFGFGQIKSALDGLERDPYIAFIPNKWMLERVPADVAARYIEWMRSMAKAARSRGLLPVLLPMSRTLDRELLASLNAGKDSPFRLFAVDDPLLIKSAIGGACAVVTSRYHGLVSSLSFGVPALVTSWSHKYRVLMEEFGIPDGTVQEDQIRGRSVAGLAALFEWIEDRDVINRLHSTASLKAAAVAAMWTEVEQLVWSDTA